MVPLFNTEISVKTEAKPVSVSTVPENKPLAFEYKNSRCEFALPELKGHQMVELKF